MLPMIARSLCGLLFLSVFFSSWAGQKLRRGWGGWGQSLRTNCILPNLNSLLSSSKASPLHWNPRSLAALAGLDNHVGELLDFRGASHVVEDGERLQVLRNTAGWGRGFWVQGVVEAQQLWMAEDKEGRIRSEVFKTAFGIYSALRKRSHPF